MHAQELDQENVGDSWIIKWQMMCQPVWPHPSYLAELLSVGTYRGKTNWPMFEVLLMLFDWKWNIAKWMKSFKKMQIKPTVFISKNYSRTSLSWTSLSWTSLSWTLLSWIPCYTKVKLFFDPSMYFSFISYRLSRAPAILIFSVPLRVQFLGFHIHLITRPARSS